MKNQVDFPGGRLGGHRDPGQSSTSKNFKITYYNGPDLRTTISQLFRIKGVPETYFIGKDGRLKDFQIGPFSSAAELQGKIDKLLE